MALTDAILYLFIQSINCLFRLHFVKKPSFVILTEVRLSASDPISFIGGLLGAYGTKKTQFISESLVRRRNRIDNLKRIVSHRIQIIL